MNEHEPRLFGLGALALVLHWLEELVNTLSGPLLVVGLGIALVDLLTDGQLTTSQPALLYVWAVSQAAGVDAQLVGAFARARHHLRHGRRWSLVGMLLLGAVLAYVGWIAAQVFATEQAEHITTTAALAQLGMNRTTWLIQRSALSVFLVCLSGWTRYHAPPKDAAAVAEAEKARLEREAELEPLRQRVRAQKALGAVGLGRQMLAAARGQDVEPERPPTGPGTPAPAPVRTDEAAEDWSQTLQLMPPPRPRRTNPQVKRAATMRARQVRTGKAGTDPYEVEAITAWLDGARSVPKMMTATGMAKSTASGWVRTLRNADQNMLPAYLERLKREGQAVAQ